MWWRRESVEYDSGRREVIEPKDQSGKHDLCKQASCKMAGRSDRHGKYGGACSADERMPK